MAQTTFDCFPFAASPMARLRQGNLTILSDLETGVQTMHGPVVNLNGESRETLLEKHIAVMEAAKALRQALAEAAPHGRDYQTDGPINYNSDRSAWARHTGNVAVIETQYRLIAERLTLEGERGYISPELRRMASAQWERERTDPTMSKKA